MESIMRDKARFYYRLGFNVLPIGKGVKSPSYDTFSCGCGKIYTVLELNALSGRKCLECGGNVYGFGWKKYQTRRQTPAEASSILWHNCSGIGAIAGISGFRNLDFDDCEDIRIVHTALKALGLPADYSWVIQSGSLKGYQLWVHCPENVGDKTVYTRKGIGFKQLEFRAQRCQSVLPPSLHPSGNRYSFVNTPPTEKPTTVSLSSIRKAFKSITLPEKKRVKQGKYSSSGDFSQIKALATVDLLVSYAQSNGYSVERHGNEYKVGDKGELGGLYIGFYNGVAMMRSWQNDFSGDVIDFVGYLRYKWGYDRGNREHFKYALGKAAELTGVSLDVQLNRRNELLNSLLNSRKGKI